jgi:hypothetical protein
VASNSVVGQPFDLGTFVARGKELKGADANMAGGDTGEDGAGERCFPTDGFPCRDGGQRAGGGYAQRMHGFADDIFAQHRPQCRLAIAAPRKGRATGAFQLHIPAPTMAVDQLAEQEGAAIAQLRGEMTELMPRISLGERMRLFRHSVPRKNGGTEIAIQCRAIEPQFFGQRVVQ